MTAPSHARTAIVMPVGPGAYTALDTLASVEHYCSEPHEIIIVDDCTNDGTYEALLGSARDYWHILRNPRPMERWRLVHTLCAGYRYVLMETGCELVFRLDQDALVIKPGVISDALDYMETNPAVGLFGVYAHDYDRPRSYQSHCEQMNNESHWLRKAMGLQPAWTNILRLAEQRGYSRGDNVFGGAYFATRAALCGMENTGALAVPYRWHSRLMEDVYFSMATVAAGFDLGHFGAPEGPLCRRVAGTSSPSRRTRQQPLQGDSLS